MSSNERSSGKENGRSNLMTIFPEGGIEREFLKEIEWSDAEFGQEWEISSEIK